MKIKKVIFLIKNFKITWGKNHRFDGATM